MSDEYKLARLILEGKNVIAEVWKNLKERDNRTHAKK